MNESGNKLIYLLWSVIAVLIVGAVLGGFVLIRHVHDVDQTNSRLMGDNDSLKRQVREAKATPTPTPTPVPAHAAAPKP
jgi:hypothetical protein